MTPTHTMNNASALALALAYRHGGSDRGAPMSRIVEPDDPTLETFMVHLWMPSRLSPRLVVEVITYRDQAVVNAAAYFSDEPEGIDWLNVVGLDG